MMKKEEIKHILHRIPISPAQLAMFKILYYADQPLTLNSMAYMTGHRSELSGVLGALTNRIAWTEGVEDLPEPAYLAFFDVEIIKGIKHFSMRPELQQAINETAKLRKIIEKFTVDEIYDRFNHDEPYWLDLSE